ncbi:MAG: DUF5658 family protein [Pyrinomonadaceae bacterium]
MPISRRTILLFTLNLLDALLTIYWVRHGFATESNQLMAGLLDMGNAPFLAVKVMIGAVAAIVLSRWGNLKIAQYGLTIVLAIYLGLMGIHFFTGLSAFGYISENFVGEFSAWSQNLFC